MTTGYFLPNDAGRHSPFIQFDFLTRAVEAVPQVDNERSPAAYTMSYSDLAAITHLVKENAGMVDSDLEGGPSSMPITLIARSGLFVVVETCADMERLFPSMLQQTNINNGPVTPLKKSPKNVLDIVVIKSPPHLSEDEVSAYFSNYLAQHEDDLCACGIRRVTYICGSAVTPEVVPTTSGGTTPAYGLNGTVGNIFTYRARTHFREDHLFRHIESAYAFHLDLMRLDNFDISLVNGLQTSSGNVQLYMAFEKGFQAKTATRLPVRRYYARLVSFTSDIHSSDAESLFVEALDTLALAIGHEEHSTQIKKHFKGTSSSGNHIFLNVVAPDVVIQPDFFENELKRFCTKYSQKMQRLFVATVEFKLTCRLMPTADPLFIRLVASNPTGYVLKVESYYETLEDKVVVFRGINQKKGEWEGEPISTPYAVSKPFDAQRSMALASSETLYVYDWPVLFEKAAGEMWEAYIRDKTPPYARSPGPAATAAAIPEGMLTCEELVLCERDEDGEFAPLPAGWTADGARNSCELRSVARGIGKNDVGMVAWNVTLKTPEYPSGRQFVIVANDITFSAGSFGTKEDLMFYKVSEYCRNRGVPRLYLAANSGARIGMAQSLKSKFRVCWTDSKDPSRGFQYIYLSEDDYEEFCDKYGDVTKLPVICKEVTDPASGELRYVITDIIGEEDDLGVENLMGSGLIAGETSKAYDDIFTLTLVVGRTVGIGAYLVRLGQRTIQKVRASPIILTGFQALNKLMGRDIYTSNDQLGGPMIMYPNGVSHLLADTHLDCITKALEWLAFVPSVKGGALPMRQLAAEDRVERPVLFCPQKGVSYDPRHMLAGHFVQLPSGEERWVSGFFDRSSFVETLGGWAKTVVVGRARLGGLPLGVIVTENRTAEAMKPADPADPTSQERLVQQAGGVWFPDSAYKTAQV
jgi:acetyl-CoA carboxylase/biotin carboxylase 1